MQTLIALLGFLMVIASIVMAARTADRLDAALRNMTDEQLAEESWWESQDGHYPNPFSHELDRRAA